MKLEVYNGEYFDRKLWRYLIFVGLILVLVVLSIVFDNIRGGAFLLLLLAGYFYIQNKSSTAVKISLEDTGLLIDKRFISYADLRGFALEGNPKTGKAVNLILIKQRGYEIFSILDTEEQVMLFTDKLSEYIPNVEQYSQSFLDKLMRKLKI